MGIIDAIIVIKEYSKTKAFNSNIFHSLPLFKFNF